MDAGLYIHIPYCHRKCLYCDFYSGGARTADWNALTDTLLREATSRRDELDSPFTTLYLGGGTPSLLPPQQLERLLDGLRDIFGKRLRPDEVTIEVNPEDVSDEAIDFWRRCGMTRVSMGVQCLVAEELAAIGRRHDPDTALRALDILTASGMRVSVDIMFALPGQTEESLAKTVEGLLSRRPGHFSAYALMFEEGTAMTRLRDTGRFREADEGTYLRLYSLLINRLRAAGYEHYEISNFALPGERSRHNTLYWQGRPYLGLGPSAHSYDGMRTRRANPADIRGYLAHDFAKPFYTAEHLDDEEVRDEYLLTRMRMREGIGVDDFRLRFGQRVAEQLLDAATKCPGVDVSDGRIALTEEGVMTSDDVILRLASSL